MEAANDVGDTRKLYSGQERTDKKPAVDLQVDKQGDPISSAKERAAAWYDFLKAKFAAKPGE